MEEGERGEGKGVMTRRRIPPSRPPAADNSALHLQEAVGAGDPVEEGGAGQDEQGGLRGLVVEELEGVDPQLVLPRLDEQLVERRGQQPRGRPKGAGLFLFWCWVWCGWVVSR